MGTGEDTAEAAEAEETEERSKVNARQCDATQDESEKEALPHAARSLKEWQLCFWHFAASLLLFFIFFFGL